jgi:hypothetical protein
MPGAPMLAASMGWYKWPPWGPHRGAAVGYLEPPVHHQAAFQLAR